MAAVTYLCAAASHVGLKRRNNEDRFLLDAVHGLYLVIDGMGGHAGGEVAAEIAATTIGEFIAANSGDDGARLKSAIVHANNAIFRASRRDESLSGMGCVLVALLLKSGTAVIGHVGDARLYKVRPDRMEILTTDHSLVSQMEKAGELSEIRLMQHPRRHEVLRCVGVEERDAEEDNFVDIFSTDFQPEDAFLLCSDGLTDSVPFARLFELIHANAESPEVLVRSLISEANEAGGKDNVTVIFVTGSRFSHAVSLLKDRSTPSLKERLASRFLSRKATLLYGLILGCLLVYLLRCLSLV